MIGVALLMGAVGFAQFSPAAVLGDVADHFGETGPGDTIAEQAGLSGTVLGAGLAIIRLASLGALALASLADRRGRHPTVLWCAALGLALTVAAGASPGYWWFVVALALARPLLTATNTVAEVLAAEYTGSSDRAKALALTAAAYGVGSGLVVVLRAGLEGLITFRGVFALAVIPLVGVAVARRLIHEPHRYRGSSRQAGTPLFAGFGPDRRRLLLAMAGVVFAAALITGPANTLLFVYAENVLDASSTFTAVLVVSAAPMGLAGLVAGRALADNVGRRPTVAGGLVLLAASALGAYSGTLPALAAGYLVSVFFGSVFATPALALATELFPTSMRASVAGWLVVSGVLGATAGLALVGATADVFDTFTAAMAVVCVPAALTAALVALVPETRGKELEESAPEDPSPSPTASA
jgi:MFS family permease